MHALCTTHLLSAAGSMAQHQLSQTSKATMLLQACILSMLFVNAVWKAIPGYLPWASAHV